MKLRKVPLIALATAAVLSFVVYSCSKDASSPSLTSNAGKKTALDKVTLSCLSSTGASITLNVCAGGSGAPAGFSVQWMTKADFELYGWPVGAASDDQISTAPSFCKASLSGVPGCSNYNLGANACTSIKIGDNLFDECGASSSCANVPLQCGKEYVFRAFAHNDPKTGLGKSPFSANQECSTLPCSGGGDGGCTYTQGYWKTHGPIPTGNNTNVWPVTSLTLGTVSYTDGDLLSILNTSSASGNGLVSLAHQLIAAKLNIANGADASSIQLSIDAADAMIGSLVIPPVGSGSLSAASTSSLVASLTAFNEGATGPGHCP
jgi:hypothetical protein